MNAHAYGIFSEREALELKERVEREFLTPSSRRAVMPDIKTEIAVLKQTVEKLERKIDSLERVLRISD